MLKFERAWCVRNIQLVTQKPGGLKGATHVTSCVRSAQENSMNKTNHGGSDRDSELQTRQTPTDAMMDRKQTS
jgi:hypothetical protein